MLEKEIAGDIANYFSSKGFSSNIRFDHNGYFVLINKAMAFPALIDPNLRESRINIINLIGIIKNI